MAEDEPKLKPVHWVGSSRDDLRDLPPEVTREIGFALWFAQMGDKHPSAKPLKHRAPVHQVGDATSQSFKGDKRRSRPISNFFRFHGWRLPS